MISVRCWARLSDASLAERIPALRFGQPPGDLVDYTPTEPLRVVEVHADACFEHDRWRHPTGFRRVRLDLHADEITGSQAR